MGKKKSSNYTVNINAPSKAKNIEYSPKPSYEKTVGVNLKYYRSKFECFSEWQKKELNQFSKWIKKISGRTEAEITSTTKTCHAHKGPDFHQYLPREISPDITTYNMDVGRKLRIHGFFSKGDFYIVLLDREHRALDR